MSVSILSTLISPTGANHLCRVYIFLQIANPYNRVRKYSAVKLQYLPRRGYLIVVKVPPKNQPYLVEVI